MNVELHWPTYPAPAEFFPMILWLLPRLREMLAQCQFIPDWIRYAGTKANLELRGVDVVRLEGSDLIRSDLWTTGGEVIIKWCCAASLSIALFANSACCQKARALGEKTEAEALWSMLVLNDLAALRKILQDSHPGVVDPENGSFNDSVARAYTAARNLAKRVSGYDAAYFALKKFTKGFNDDHVILYEVLSKAHAQYPQFVAAIRDKQYVVTESLDPSVSVGSIITSCDGKDVESLYRTNVLAYYGVDGVRANYIGFAPYLFVDLSNPFVAKPSVCQFRAGGQDRTVQLTWITIDRRQILDKLHDAAYGQSAELGIEEWHPGHFWIGLPDFAFTADNGQLSGTADQMNKLIESISNQAIGLRAAKVIVFDVRGNHGGSSVWGDKLLQAIWGDGITDNLMRHTYDQIEWRTSSGNIAANERYAASYRAKFGLQDPTYRHLEALVATMKAARDRGQALVKAGDMPPDRSRAQSPQVVPKIILLGNGTCFSACNDFSDEVLSFRGAELWGADNAADSVYIDNRGETLPSGLFRVSLPMKVWRGRYRGNNVAYEATRKFETPFFSKAAAQRWVDQELSIIDVQ